MPAGVRGGERPRLTLLNLGSGSVQGGDLRSSYYHNPLPDSSGHDRTVRLASTDASRRYVVVPDVGGYFR